ncbi:hypothetical protein FB45DRAFT_861222 [Roridomyces roridus]|uniref:Uncharacterized protein n=1 Tax=Roridomyces roridus TaxID=1738132 RepID=A0AAD7CAB9_9AGAR|nr:hypothetical protein FB45DRAFT_861222 [Roridomyces roridus]
MVTKFGSWNNRNTDDLMAVLRKQANGGRAGSGKGRVGRLDIMVTAGVEVRARRTDRAELHGEGTVLEERATRRRGQEHVSHGSEGGLVGLEGVGDADAARKDLEAHSARRIARTSPFLRHWKYLLKGLVELRRGVAEWKYTRLGNAEESSSAICTSISTVFVQAKWKSYFCGLTICTKKITGPQSSEKLVNERTTPSSRLPRSRIYGCKRYNFDNCIRTLRRLA